MIEPDNTQKRLINNIAVDLLGHNTTFFIGAGFSIDLGYPSWTRLLKEIIKKYDLMEKIKESSLFYLLSEDEETVNQKINETIVDNLVGVDFLRLAGYVNLLLEEEKNTNIKKVITSIIESNEIKREMEIEKLDEYREVFSNIRDYIREVITTNYDTNLERCIDNRLVIHRNISSLNRSQHSTGKDTVKIYKIHGCISDNEQGIIITEKDYQEFSSSNKYLFHKIYSTFMENNIVFIGYSLNDPNIRGLLNEVIEEIKQNKEAKKKIYWVTRGTVNPIDKKFYEQTYEMQIIDKIEILDFFRSLINLKDAIEIEWVESTDKLLKPIGLSQSEFNDIISKTVRAEKQSEALNQIYQAFITNSSPRGTASIAFFTILSEIKPEEVEAFDDKITNILLTEDTHLISIIDLIQKNNDVKKIFTLKEYERILLESLISRAQSDNSFYQYELYAKALLVFYGVFDGSLGEFEKTFIDAFYYNYKYLTNTKTKGYAFESLKTVQEALNNLNEEMIVKILNRYPNITNSDIQFEQIETLIDIIPDPIRQNELKYKFIHQPTIFETLRRSIIFRTINILSRDKGFKSKFDNDIFEDGKLIGSFESLTGNGDVTINEDDEGFLIAYNGKDLTIKVTSDFITGETHLVINGTVYNETKSSKIRDLIKPIIDDTFKNWGLLSEETVQSS